MDSASLQGSHPTTFVIQGDAGLRDLVSPRSNRPATGPPWLSLQRERRRWHKWMENF
jgi:hypothetical protein